MLTLIENGEIYAPEPRGRQSILLIGDKIVRIGEEIDARVAASILGIELEVIDAAGCVVTPGIIDPHSHLIGGSGEEGFASRTPDIQLSEIVTCGITTIVGVLGVDATTRPLISLLAKVKGLREEGMTAYLYTGHYGIPPATFSGSIRNDLMIVEEVIGVGEVAISDHRAPQPSTEELARVVVDAHVGGMLSSKAGIAHFHVGESPRRLKPLLDLPGGVPRDLGGVPLSDPPQPQPGAAGRGDRARPPGLLRGHGLGHRGHGPLGAPLLRARRGRQEIDPFLGFGQQRAAPALSGGPAVRPRIPHAVGEGAGAGHRQHRERAEAGGRGTAAGKDADLLVLRRDSLEIVEVIARGRRMVKQGDLAIHEKVTDARGSSIWWVRSSFRRIPRGRVKHAADRRRKSGVPPR